MEPLPDKPSADFPLYPHRSGKWAKKIEGRTCYFGRWEDPGGALAEFHAMTKAPAIATGGGLTLKDACNLWLYAKEQAMRRGELSQRSFADYKRTAISLADHWGRERMVMSLGPADFSAYKAALAERRQLVALGNEIVRVRSFFKYLFDQRLIPTPIHFGPDFRKPPARAVRKEARARGKRLFAAAEIRAVLDQASVQYRAIVLLGVNAGLGPTDCAQLTLSALDLDAGWLDYPRPKTEIDRRVPLWPETQDALSRTIACRPTPHSSAESRVFLRPDGGPITDLEITKRFSSLRQHALVQQGSFYWLRHCCETIGGGAKDQVAVNYIMGHVDASMAAIYREGIDDERLVAVAEHVRRWLFSQGL